MKVKLINTTPHAINIVKPDGSEIVLPLSENPVRVREEKSDAGNVNGIPVARKRYAEAVNLPEFAEGICYVVSLPVAQALASTRGDLLMVDDLVRDESGRIIGCRGFSILS